MGGLPAGDGIIAISNQLNHLVVPAKAVAETVEMARESRSTVRKKPEEIYDNS